MQNVWWLVLWAATVGQVVYFLNRRVSALEDRIRQLEATISERPMS